MIHNRKLSTAFLMPILLAIFSMMMILTIFDAAQSSERLMSELTARGEEQMDIAAAAAVEAFWSYNDTSLKNIGETLFNYEEVARISLFDERGTVVYQKIKQEQAYELEHLHPTFSRIIYKDGQRIGEMDLVLTHYFVGKAVREDIVLGIIRTLVIVFVMSGVILLLTRKLTTSIDQIAEGVKAFSKGDANGRIQVEDRHEIGELSQRLNRMFDSILESRKQLTQNYQNLLVKEEALRVSEERYRYAVEGSNDMIWDWNVENDDFFISQSGRQLVGISEKEKLTSRSWIVFIHPQDRLQFEHFLYGCRLKPTVYAQIQYRLIGSKGEVRWLFCRGKGILDGEGKLIRISGFCTDITDRIKAEESINKLAYYDVLTGLPNRAMLFGRLDKLFIDPSSSGHGGALFYLDLDDFKTINDTKGHAVGDKLLVSIADAFVKEIDCEVISRVGGDEFVFIHKDCDDVMAGAMADQLSCIIRTPWTIDHEVYNMTCSIGIALFPLDGNNIETLLMNADSAVFQAKSAGKDNFAFYEKSINDEMVKKVELQNEIRQGIANQEFVLYYQPQICMKTEKIVGVEALVRWQHPQQGLIPPIVFIPIAEESGLIVPLGEFVMMTACRQSVELELAGYKDITMAVNISAKQFSRKKLYEDILRIVKDTGMSPGLLDLEITESVAIENLDNTLQLINRLKDHGVRFSLDDFGTGYSSLNYLKNLPINHLKIDKHFVQNVAEGGFEEVVVKAIIDIAHSMDLVIIAEGIEEKQQLDILKGYGCDLAQGYYYSRPIPVDELHALLEKEKNNER